MTKLLCECGDWQDQHTILPNQTFCRGIRCDCLAFVPRTAPSRIRACERCEGAGHWPEVDKTDGGVVLVVCQVCSGSGRLHANGDTLVRDLTLS